MWYKICCKVNTTDEHKEIREELKTEKQKLEEDIKTLEAGYELLRSKNSKEKLNILQDFHNVKNNSKLTWEEQNQLYKTIINYIQYTRVDKDIK